jgi:hypothetical protein
MIFESECTHEDAMEELVNSEYYIPGEDYGILCDSCYNEFTKWFRENNIKGII